MFLRIPNRRITRSCLELISRMKSTTKAADFDGEVALLYKKLSEQHRHERGPWNLILKKLISLKLSSGKIVDLASGPGEPAVTLASSLPHMTIFATDISPDMVNIAAAKAVSIPNMKAMVADAQNLSVFADNSIDVVTCCYGYMFPPDKHKALSETYRILKPGGTLIATYWANVDTVHIVYDILRAVLNTAHPPELTVNPMSLSTPNLFDTLLIGAGFSNPIESVKSQYPFDLGTDETYQYKLSVMLIKDKLNELNAHDIAYDAFKDSIQKYAVTDPDTGAKVLHNNVFVMASVTK